MILFDIVILASLSIAQSFAYHDNQHLQHHQPVQNNQDQNQNLSNQNSSNLPVESRDNYQSSSSYGWPSHDDHHDSGHGQSLHSYFDIALTALAFLSFGIFLLNLLLNALLFAGLVTATGTGTQTGNTGNTGGIMTQTMTGTQTQTMGTMTGGRSVTAMGRLIKEYRNSSSLVNDDDSRRVRGKRATLELFLDPGTSMDSLAHNVLKSIDAMMEKHECVGKVFCEGNRQAKIIGSGFQYLMPLYSMSASYFGKKFGWHENLLDHLTGIVLGVGDSNCHSHFPEC